MALYMNLQIFHIDKFKEQIVNMEGFGEKSYSNLIASINNAERHNSKTVYSLGFLTSAYLMPG